ncbi:MAG: hypothetical protein LC808_32060, partial [Actinobacteria bacterium]|nr:hypothetical protein [Actinomycetota bacterium]
TEIDSVTTDAEGAAVISAASLTDGGHVIRVIYAGDDTHWGAKRAQGVHVGAEEEPTRTRPAPVSSPTPAL